MGSAACQTCMKSSTMICAPVGDERTNDCPWKSASFNRKRSSRRFACATCTYRWRRALAPSPAATVFDQ
jgi:protein-arginine kinase activator protein McsA